MEVIKPELKLLGYISRLVEQLVSLPDFSCVFVSLILCLLDKCKCGWVCAEKLYLAFKLSLIHHSA